MTKKTWILCILGYIFLTMLFNTIAYEVFGQLYIKLLFLSACLLLAFVIIFICIKIWNKLFA